MDNGLTLPPEPPADSENLVSFVTGKPVSEFPLTSVRHTPGYCIGNHRRVYVVEGTRMLECQDCKKAIDPFDYLLTWAHKGDSRLSSLRDMDAQIAKRHAELKRIRMDVDNAKSQLQRVRTALVNEAPAVCLAANHAEASA